MRPEPKVVLIVDDSQVVRRFVSLALRPLGCELIEAGSGEEALRALAARLVDVVIADINMPGMDGPELIRRVKSNPILSGTRVIVLSTEARARADLLDAGASAWIQKPCRPDELRKLVTESLYPGGVPAAAAPPSDGAAGGR